MVNLVSGPRASVHHQPRPIQRRIWHVRTRADIFLFAKTDLSPLSSSSLHGPLLGSHPSNTRTTPLVPLDRETISTTTSSSMAISSHVYRGEKYKRSTSPRSRAENGPKIDHHFGGGVSGGGSRRKAVEMCRRSTGGCSTMWCRLEQKAVLRIWGRTGQHVETDNTTREGAAEGNLEYVHRACECPLPLTHMG